MFDSTTPPTYCQPPLRRPQMYSPYRISYRQSVADAVIQLRFPRPLPVIPLRREGWTSRRNKLDGCTTIVALDNNYIINYLHLKAYPGVSDEKLVSKSFSYTVKLSRDKSSWLELFDYSSFACRGAQHLPFPKQAAR